MRRGSPVAENGGMSDSLTPDSVLDDALAIAAAAQLCFLVTAGSDGVVDARLMQPFEWRRDEPIWFGTDPNTRKVQQIRQTGVATVCYQSPAGGAYATLRGAIAEQDARAHRELWRDDWEQFFPGGADGDRYTLLRFDPTHIEVLDFASGIAPDPYGVRPAALQTGADGWRLAD